jgi:hypothetical protein
MRLEGRPGAGDRQLGGAEAGPEIAALRHPARPIVPRSRRGPGVFNVIHGTGGEIVPSFCPAAMHRPKNVSMKIISWETISSNSASYGASSSAAFTSSTRGAVHLSPTAG